MTSSESYLLLRTQMLVERVEVADVTLEKCRDLACLMRRGCDFWWLQLVAPFVGAGRFRLFLLRLVVALPIRRH